MSKNRLTARFSSDHIAIALSLLCTAHCLLLPILVLVMPTLTGFMFLSDESFHVWILLAVIPISILAVVSGYIQHKRLSTLLICSIGIGLLIFSAFWGHDVLGHEGEIAATVLGSMFVAYGHIKNLRLRGKGCELPTAS